MISPGHLTGGEFFARLDLINQGQGWFLLIASDPRGVANDIAETFTTFDERVEILDTAGQGPRALTHRPTEGRRIIAVGSECWTAGQASDCDLFRQRILSVHPLLILITTQQGAELLARNAPNCMSFFAVNTALRLDMLNRKV